MYALDASTCTADPAPPRGSSWCRTPMPPRYPGCSRSVGIDREAP
jgi:hypothetical protein